MYVQNVLCILVSVSVSLYHVCVSGCASVSLYVLVCDMATLLFQCNQLQRLGVDAGALVFEDKTVMACGSERLRHHRSRPHLAALMAGEL